MKTAYLNTTDTLTTFVTPEGNNVLEGTPSGLPKVKACTTVTGRPHILARRAARRQRRAAH